MNSQQVEYFLHAAKLLNFSKVAEELCISQPTVSRQLALLEEELGFPLFSRQKGVTKLTAGGAIMMQVFEEIGGILDAAVKRVSSVLEGLEGRISIGYLNHMNTDWFVHPPALAFSRRYPQIDISMEGATFSNLRAGLNSGFYDLIYIYSFEIPAMENIVAEKCYAVTPMLIMSNLHPLARKPDLRAEDFCNQIFLTPGPEESDGRAGELIRLCSKFGIKDIVIRSMKNIDSVMFGMRSGWGVALLSSDTRYALDSRYTSFPLPENSDEQPLYIASIRKKDNMNPAIPLYMELCSDNRAIDVFVTQ